LGVRGIPAITIRAFRFGADQVGFEGLQVPGFVQDPAGGGGVGRVDIGGLGGVDGLGVAGGDVGVVLFQPSDGILQGLAIGREAVTGAGQMGLGNGLGVSGGAPGNPVGAGPGTGDEVLFRRRPALQQGEGAAPGVIIWLFCG